MFRRARIGLFALSLLWLGGTYVLGATENYQELRDRFERHLLDSATRGAKLEEVERRVAQIEMGARADRIDVRIARIEANLDSARAMLWGLGAPVALMAVEAI